MLHRRAGSSLRGRVGVFVAGSTGLLLFVSAVTVLDVERDARDANQLRDAYAAARADALRVEALKEAERLGQPLTPDEHEWAQKRALLERQYLSR